MKNVTSNPVQGAMYLFPSFDFPEKFLIEAQKQNLPADTYYALKLLNATGICVVPGSGFG